MHETNSTSNQQNKKTYKLRRTDFEVKSLNLMKLQLRNKTDAKKTNNFELNFDVYLDVTQKQSFISILSPSPPWWAFEAFVVLDDKKKRLSEDKSSFIYFIDHVLLNHPKNFWCFLSHQFTHRSALPPSWIDTPSRQGPPFNLFSIFLSFFSVCFCEVILQNHWIEKDSLPWFAFRGLKKA